MQSENPSEIAGSALVIGASRGLGHAMAQELARRGWRVTGTVRGDGRTQLHDLADEFESQIAIELLDINKPDQIVALDRRLAGQAFDMMFVNAGVMNDDMNETIAETTTEEFTRLMITNTLSPMRVIEGLQDRVTPHGMIGVMSSGLASIGDNTGGGNEVYRASKAALNMCMRSYAARQADAGRSLVLLAPGWIRTDLGGEDAPITMDEAMPEVVDTLLIQQGRPGLHYVDRAGRTLPW
ncbi:SDR family oxidoreductase [Paracoccus sp. 11-3]|uniref:SDR family oxidoreductase n=1 Tax=Paracoccus amoyensis TaxID=2760093 RepID=A0A926JCF8_9RHOB|nr:SDR family oxidoreductase [Paracoccus amoyensis]MBC9246324.1 SDR family oxidoreductase [Paracoccus amoyensis]